MMTLADLIQSLYGEQYQQPMPTLDGLLAFGPRGDGVSTTSKDAMRRSGLLNEPAQEPAVQQPTYDPGQRQHLYDATPFRDANGKPVSIESVRKAPPHVQKGMGWDKMLKQMGF